MPGAYYNEIDPFAAQWLRNLIAAGLIADGEVDERSIVEVSPDDLRGFTQCHFFAGIGGWSYALRLAGWDDARPVWTGSCPCQPFSAAGKREAFDDERHLWPAFFRLIRERLPVACFGEQVASRDALAWLDHVCADLEGEGYAVGAVDSCAAGFGAPHIRQRLYWVACGVGLANSTSQRADGGLGIEEGAWDERRAESSGGREDGFMADAMPARRPEGRAVAGDGSAAVGSGSDVEALGNPIGERSQGRQRSDGVELHRAEGSNGSTATSGFWRDSEWLPCRDGKARPVEPGTFPLAHGIPARVGRLRGYGNAIVAPQAAAFVRAFCEVMP